MSDTGVGILNYAQKYSATAIGARIYFDTLQKFNQDVSWYQIADFKTAQDYMSFPRVLTGSRVPVKKFRMGYDRMYYLPKTLLSEISESFVYLADPTLIKLGLKKKAFMIKIHDLIRISRDSPGITSNLMFRYVFPKVKFATAIIVTTSFMKKELIERGLERDRIKVVHEPVDQDLESTKSRSGKELLAENPLKLLYVAADREYKRIDFFLDLAKYFQDKGMKNYSFVLVSSIGEKTRKYLQALGLRNLILIEEANSLNDIYNKCDVLVFPSENEGFGRPIVEALAQGIPTIARRIQPFIEIVGDSGCLLEDDQEETWTNAIQRITEPEVYTALSGKAKARFHEKFSRSVFENALLDAFEFFKEEVAH